MYINTVTAAVLDLVTVFITAKTLWIYTICSIFSGLNSICLLLTSPNTMYLNMPRQDTDHYTIFHSVFNSVFALLGSVFGTWFLAMLERPDGGRLFAFVGLDFYPSQLLVVCKLLIRTALAAYILWIIPRTQPDRT